MPTPFDFDDYKKYLHAAIGAQPNNGWGFRSELAAALRCQTAYLSRVLNAGADFSPEQADRAARFLNLDEDETEFFLTLVEHARSGTASLRARYGRRLKAMTEGRLNFKKRFKVAPALSLEHQVTYYSAWYYAAIHVLLSVPRYQTREAICAALDLPASLVSGALAFLVSTGLAVEQKGMYQIGKSRIHLGNDSALLTKHLNGWRLQALQSIERHSPEILHYSGAVTMSDEDALKIRAVLVKSIEQCNQIVAPSKEEGAHCLNVDFFRIDRT